MQEEEATLTLWLRRVTPADLKSGNLMPAVSGTAWRKKSTGFDFIFNFWIAITQNQINMLGQIWVICYFDDMKMTL